MRGSFFTTEDTENTEARKRKGSPDLGPNPSLLIRLCVLGVLCGERSGNCTAFNLLGALGVAGHFYLTAITTTANHSPL
jgi:hypothetical protein